MDIENWTIEKALEIGAEMELESYTLYSETAAKAKELLDFWTEEVVKKENNPLLADKAKKQVMEELVKMSQE